MFTLGGSASYNSLLNTSNAYIAGPNAIVKTIVLGASKAINLVSQSLPDHQLQISYRGSSGTFQQLVDTSFMGYEQNRFLFSVPATSLGTSFTHFLYFSVANAVFTSNRTVVSYIKIRYPHTFDLEGKSTFQLFLPDNALQSKSYLNIQNFSASGGVVFYDLKNNKRIGVIQNGANYQFDPVP